MRSVHLRPYPRLLAAACAVVTLVSCRGEPGLPSAEVLDRAAEAARNLQSATFTADLSLKADTGISGTVHADGRLQNGGDQWDFTLRAALGGGFMQNIDVTADVIVIEENEVYVRMQNAGNTALPFPLGPDAAGLWLRLPSAGRQSPPAADVTPDPRLLAMQAGVVKVTKDRGIVRQGDRRVYHYDVATDEEKFRAFLKEVATERGEEMPEEELNRLLVDTQLTGQLWIDAETFEMLRVSWGATPRTENGYEGSLTVELRDHNAAPPIVPPEGAQSLDSVLSAPSDVVPFMDAGNLPPEEREQLQQLLEQQ